MKSKAFAAALIAAASVVGTKSVFAAAFTAGNLAVLDVASTGAPGNTGNPIEILELTPTASASPVQTVVDSGLFQSGTATSSALLNLTNGGTQLAYVGETATGAGNVNAVTSRAVHTIDSTGAITAAATYTATAGNQSRSVVTDNGSAFYIADQGGIYRDGGTAAVANINPRGLQQANGVTYVNTNSTTVGALDVLTPGSPEAGAPYTLTPLTLAAGTTFNNVNDFILLSSAGDSSFDTLYAATSTGIAKYTLSGTTLTADGTTAIAGGLASITGSGSGNAITLDFVVGSGGAGSEKVESLIDSGGTAALAASAPTVLFTAGTNDVLKGIALVPVPEPTTLSLIALSGLGLLARRRKA